MIADRLAPLQPRSRETLRRILDATESLLEERLFDDVSVAEIMECAGMAVGTFYRRFPTKDALLPHLYERYDERLRSEEGSWLDTAAWSGLGPRERVARLTRMMVRAYRERRGLWRAVLVHAVAHPESVSEEQHRSRRQLVKRLGALLAGDGRGIRHPEPRLAGELGVTLAMALCKEKILLETPARAQSPRLSDHRLARELERMLLGYLGIRGGRADR